MSQITALKKITDQRFKVLSVEYASLTAELSNLENSLRDVQSKIVHELETREGRINQAAQNADWSIGGQYIQLKINSFSKFIDQAIQDQQLEAKAIEQSISKKNTEILEAKKRLALALKKQQKWNEIDKQSRAEILIKQATKEEYSNQETLEEMCNVKQF